MRVILNTVSVLSSQFPVIFRLQPSDKPSNSNNSNTSAEQYII